MNTCNMLPLWSARAAESFDFEAFNAGDYCRAVEDKVDSENITKVLYPNDEPDAGKRLRLEQQYFFVSCSLQRHPPHRRRPSRSRPSTSFPSDSRSQLNDTHPAIAVAELMRLLVDEHGMDWDEAWDITVATFAYTNHTLLPEALETWPLALFGELLPRHLEIIYEINRRFLDEVRAQFPGDEDRLRADVADRRGRRQARAHGAPRDRRQPRDQRRRRAALRAAARRPCSRTSTSSGRSGSPT